MNPLLNTRKVRPGAAGTVPKAGESAPKLVAFLVFDGFQPIDLAGPWQAFATANEEVGFPVYRQVTVAQKDAVTSADGALKIHGHEDAVCGPRLTGKHGSYNRSP